MLCLSSMAYRYIYYYSIYQLSLSLWIYQTVHPHNQFRCVVNKTKLSTITTALFLIHFIIYLLHFTYLVNSCITQQPVPSLINYMLLAPAHVLFLQHVNSCNIQPGRVLRHSARQHGVQSRVKFPWGTHATCPFAVTCSFSPSPGIPKPREWMNE